MTQKTFNFFVWVILAFAILVPFIVWGQGIDWQLGSISIYRWFPLFGLLAWMVMWTHYITGTLVIKYPILTRPKIYKPFTEYLVLASLLLHPGLLIYAQWKNGAGLPPNSYLEYVGEALALAVMFGTIALIIFLSYEFFDRLQHKQTIKRWWPAISISQSIAMILIFVHGLRLGTNLSSGWFVYVWIACGIALLPCFYIIHEQDFANRRINKK
jgi:hypothetical protein